MSSSYGAVLVHQLLRPYITQILAGLLFHLCLFCPAWVLQDGKFWSCWEVAVTIFYEAGVCSGWNLSMAAFRHCGGVGLFREEGFK